MQCSLLTNLQHTHTLSKARARVRTCQPPPSRPAALQCNSAWRGGADVVVPRPCPERLGRTLMHACAVYLSCSCHAFTSLHARVNPISAYRHMCYGEAGTCTMGSDGATHIYKLTPRLLPLCAGVGVPPTSNAGGATTATQPDEAPSRTSKAISGCDEGGRVIPCLQQRHQGQLLVRRRHRGSGA